MQIKIDDEKETVRATTFYRDFCGQSTGFVSVHVIRKMRTFAVLWNPNMTTFNESLLRWVTVYNGLDADLTRMETDMTPI
jgi:hypothetical protein